MSAPRFENVSDSALHEKVKALRGEENKIVAEVIAHLCEIDKRGIYRDAGYPSLFTYCTQALGFSEGSAHRRVQAARCMAKSPDLYERIREGKITLCALAEVSRVMTEENRVTVLNTIEGVSKRQAEVVAVQFGSAEKAKRECIRPKKVVVAPTLEAKAEPVEERFSFSFEVSREVRELFEEAKELTGTCSIAEMFEKSLREFVSKRKAQLKIKGTSPVEGKGRYIPKAVKQEVRVRDNEQCTYVSADGHRCTERCGLQFDHVMPFAFGGRSNAENLRLLCPAHNQLQAELCFGKAFIVAKRRGYPPPEVPFGFV